MTFYHKFDCSSFGYNAVCAGDMNQNSVVMVLHGLTVCKETQKTDLERLSESGFFSVAIDAPHHGERSTGVVELMYNMQPYDRHHIMMAIVLQQAAEVADLITMFKKQGKKVAVAGISMGAHTTFALLRMKQKPDFIASFLGAADFRARDLSITYPPSIIETSGPYDYLETVYPAPLFMVTGGKDTIVPASYSRKFYESLKPYYKKQPQLLQYHEYPDSEHMMQPQDWKDAWQKFTNRLNQEGFNS